MCEELLQSGCMRQVWTMTLAQTCAKTDDLRREDKALALSQGHDFNLMKSQRFVAVNIDLLCLLKQEFPGSLQCPLIQFDDPLGGQPQTQALLAAAPHHSAEDGFLKVSLHVSAEVAFPFVLRQPL